MANGTVGSMKIPDTYVPYLEKYRIYELLQELLSRLIIQRPEDHLQFLKNEIFDVVKTKDPYHLNNNSERESMKSTKLKLRTNNEIASKNTEPELENIDVQEKILTDLLEENRPKIKAELHSNEKPPIENEKIKEDCEDTMSDKNETCKDDSEYSKYCEHIISDWKKIRRQKKWFSIRQLRKRNDSEDLSFFKKGEKNKIDDGSNLINFSFHTEEKPIHQNETENFQLNDLSDEDRRKVKKTIKTFDIKLDKGGKISKYEHVIGLSYIRAENINVYDEEKMADGQDIIDTPVEVLDRVPGDSIEDVKAYIVKLVQTTVDEIIGSNPKDSQRLINYSFCYEKEIKKKIHFPRGPFILPRVVILGPPGSGKSLQASLLAKKLNTIHVEMDSLLIREKRKNKIFKEFSAKRCSLRNECSVTTLNKRFLEEDCLKHGWVLTGFPVNASQALALDKIETPPNRIIYLNREVNVCRQTLVSRAFDVDSDKLCFLRPDYFDTSISSSIENEMNLSSPGERHMSVSSGKNMESVCPIDNLQGSGALGSVHKSIFRKIKVLRSPRDNIQEVNYCINKYECSNEELLKYYGGWCKKIDVGDLAPLRVHEAVLSVVIGPFPSFEEAGVNDRNTFDEDTTTGLGSEIEDVLKLRLKNFLSDKRSHSSFSYN